MDERGERREDGGEGRTILGGGVFVSEYFLRKKVVIKNHHIPFCSVPAKERKKNAGKLGSHRTSHSPGSSVTTIIIPLFLFR